MEPTVVSRPKVNVVPKITKIGNLAQSSEEIRKTSNKLRKTFEKGTYQKKTQLSVLNRYKKRLEIIQKDNDKKFTKKQRVKIKLPEIKKFAGSFFTAGSANDPLKSIGALAAFNALRKGAKGDVLGAIGPALVAAGIFLGPSIIKGGIGLARGGLSSGAQAGMAPTVKPRSPGSISRLNASQARFIQGQANIGDRARLVRRGFISPAGMFSRGGVEQTAKYGGNVSKVGKALGRFAKSAIPIAGAALGAADAAVRANEGDVTGASIAGTSASLDAISAGLTATGIGIVPAAVLSVVSFGLDLVNLVRDLSGASEKEAQKNKPQQDKLKQQTEKQKKLVEKKKDEGKHLTFGKTLNRYEKVVSKFEEFSKSFVFDTRVKNYEEGMEPPPPPPPPGGNVVADTQVVQDAIDFRRQFPLAPGTPNQSMVPHELHLRENTMLYNKGIGNDPTVERVHTEGSAHYSDRAIDIPINNKQLGDRVAQFWRSRGYYVIWQSAGHYDHVHVQWNAGSPQAKNINPQKQADEVNTMMKQQFPKETSQNIIPPVVVRKSSRTGSETYLPYEQSYNSPQPTIVPYPVVQQQQMTQGQSSAPMMMSGPSEQDLLNSFYKRVLLNTVA